MAAIPAPGVARGGLVGLAGQVPNLIAPPPGCRFAPRCPIAADACLAGPPPAIEMGQGHVVACLKADQARAA
jgi:peptide/nickel transport system ATP-binding protein/oligopeptide transport system ATP-binding protein